MKTKKIYHSHDYKKSWTTKIKEITPIGDRYKILLEETAFYPGGGGQPFDLGTINDIALVEVYEEGDRIFHIVGVKPNVQVNDEVTCYIDQERRLDLSQQHTGQHLLSAVFFHQINGQTSSFHLGVEYSTIDISKANISDKTIKDIEDLANQYIYENLKIKHEQVSKKELKDLPLRKQPVVENNIKLVEIEGLDYSPCGGTHLSTTGQLGILKIIKTENYKGNTRVYFKCGNRALKDYQNISIIISDLIAKLSAHQEEIIDRIDKELERNKDLSRELNIWKSKSAYWEAKDIISKNKEFIADIFHDKTYEEIERISNEITKLGNYTILFASIIDKKIIFSHSEGTKLHCGKIFKENLPNFNGRGGGSNIRAQAAFPTKEDLKGFYSYLKAEIMDIK